MLRWPWLPMPETLEQDKMTDTDQAETGKDAEKRPGSVRRRTAARLAAIQTLFQASASGKPLTDVIPGFREHFLPNLLIEFEIDRLDEDHFTRIVFAASDGGETINAVIAPLLSEGWVIERIGEVDRAVLWLAYIELRDMVHVPVRAVITEYTALAETCGADSGFVNALLDRLARDLRVAEMQTVTS